MPVVQAENGMRLLPNRVHVIAPNSEMIVTRSTLLLKKPKEPRGLRLPIDTFFRSLAEDRKDKAVCIILSGNGTDGSLGLRAVKAGFGLAIAQEPSTAEYDSMPRSAIATGLVDYVLPAEKMAARLVSYLRHAEYTSVSIAGGSTEKAPDSLQKIFQLLRSCTGHDFSFYKTKTLYRRIERRMSVHEFESLPGYVEYLERNPQEVVTLFKELLIGVTNFFRDPDAFAQLSACLRSELLADKPKDYAIRVWVPGCSSGEEVYSSRSSCGMQDALKKSWKIQIFGSDIDADAIATARAGLYPASIVTDIPAERLKRYFVAEGIAYRVKKEIREMAVFAIQDLLKDPPFTKLDLLSCRNLLIYLDGGLQKKLLPLFHYALKPDGILFLGSSESISGFADLFSVVDRNGRSFAAVPLPTPLTRSLSFLPGCRAPKSPSQRRAIRVRRGGQKTWRKSRKSCS
jgi:two-component system CheB/CheR fusion protein